jgi:hypothetical protein
MDVITLDDLLLARQRIYTTQWCNHPTTMVGVTAAGNRFVIRMNFCG